MNILIGGTVLEKINLLELKKIDTSKVEYTLLNSLRGLTDESHMHLKSIVCAYVINKIDVYKRQTLYSLNMVST